MSDEGDKAYRVAVALHNEVHGQGSLAAEIANNNALGNITLKDDLGTYGGIATLRLADDLDEQTRDHPFSLGASPASIIETETQYHEKTGRFRAPGSANRLTISFRDQTPDDPRR